MTTSIGKDWKSYFDICCLNAKKPLFQRAERPFFELMADRKNKKSPVPIETGEQMSLLVDHRSKIFFEGNIETLTRFFQQLICKADVRVAFFGDNYHSDI